MKKNVNFSEFCDSFGQGSYKDNFSYYGKKALFDYLEQYEEDTGEEIELDAIALCCEYSEYETALEAYQNYHTGTLELAETDNDTEEELEEKALEWLEEQTQVISFNETNEFMEGRTSGIIIQDF